MIYRKDGLAQWYSSASLQKFRCAFHAAGNVTLGTVPATSAPRNYSHSLYDTCISSGTDISVYLRSHFLPLSSDRWIVVGVWLRAWPVWNRRCVTVKQRIGFQRKTWSRATPPLTPPTRTAQTRLPEQTETPPLPLRGRNEGGGNSSTRSAVSHLSIVQSVWSTSNVKCVRKYNLECDESNGTRCYCGVR